LLSGNNEIPAISPTDSRKVEAGLAWFAEIFSGIAHALLGENL
jgi:hypothetical protein